MVVLRSALTTHMAVFKGKRHRLSDYSPTSFPGCDWSDSPLCCDMDYPFLDESRIAGVLR
jgi:hypothetical protein